MFLAPTLAEILEEVEDNAVAAAVLPATRRGLFDTGTPWVC